MAKKKKVATGIVVALILIIAVVAIVWLAMDEPEPAPTMPNACTDAKYKCVSKGALTIEDACNEDGGLVPQDSLSSECGTNQVCCKPKTCANMNYMCTDFSGNGNQDCDNEGKLYVGDTDLDTTCGTSKVCCKPKVEVVVNDCEKNIGYKCTAKGALTIEDACNENGGLVSQDSLSSECGTNQVCCKPKTCANTGNECVAAATASTCTRQTSLDGTCESDQVCCEPTV